MRKDMARVIIERPRLGFGGKSAVRSSRRNRDYENMPKYESPRATHKKFGNFKSLNDYLSPIYRYLDKQLGRRWDKVYSEMKEHLSMDNAVQAHIFSHIDDRIAINCREVPLSESDTGLMYNNYFGTGWDRPHQVYENQLYVCPRTNIIKRAKLRVKKKIKTTENRIRHINDTTYAVKNKGIWNIISIASYKEDKEWFWYGSAFDRDPCYIGDRRFGQYYTVYRIRANYYTPAQTKSSIIKAYDYLADYCPNVYQAWKYIPLRKNEMYAVVDIRQMNSKELRRNNLKND